VLKYGSRVKKQVCSVEIGASDTTTLFLLQTRSDMKRNFLHCGLVLVVFHWSQSNQVCGNERNRKRKWLGVKWFNMNHWIMTNQ